MLPFYSSFLTHLVSGLQQDMESMEKQMKEMREHVCFLSSAFCVLFFFTLA